MIGVSYLVFGFHDWAARIPLALSAVLLCWLTALFGQWTFGARGGIYAGLALTTCTGLFLFTRILIPDVVLTLAITVALWSLLRALERGEEHARFWAMAMWAAMGVGLLLKSLIAVVFPAATGLLYLQLTGQLWSRETWRRLRPTAGVMLLLAIAAPWHALATLRNPPYFDLTMHSERGAYHGFFWFYFINEQLLRFLNLRYPRDYNTVPRLYFWLLHIVWLFPWSVYLPAAWKLTYRGPDRASRVRLLALCWCGVVLGFFTFSTTQEYYSMPCYPALALLLGSAMTAGGRAVRYGTKAMAAIATLAAAAVFAILWLVRGLETPGDISAALKQSADPETYTLSLGHMGDLTLHAFAYLRLPLALAGAAFVAGAIGCRAWRKKDAAPVAALTVMMVLFFHAARLALVAFDPYLSSRPLAEALVRSAPGTLIVDDQYYTFSSIFFYTNRTALLLNGRVNNLVYGSFAPDAPQNVFVDDREFARLWGKGERYYLVAEGPQVPRFERLVGKASLHKVTQSGGKFLFTNS
jgi:hypothetical protein